MIIGLIGMKGGGKTTTAKRIHQLYSNKDKKVSIMSFAEPTRKFVSGVMGFDIEKDYTKFKLRKWHYNYNGSNHLMAGRDILEFVSADKKSRDPLIWLNKTMKDLENDNSDTVIFDDVRMQKELVAIQFEAYKRNVEFKFIFCDYDSEFYDESINEMNALAKTFKKQGCRDQQDVTAMLFS